LSTFHLFFTGIVAFLADRT